MSIPHWVLDTNVLVSAAITPHRTCDQLLQLAIGGRFLPAWDNLLLAEYRDVLSRPRFRLSLRSIHSLLSAFPAAGFYSAVPVEISLPDPEDLPFLKVALATPDRTIVTGNPAHFPRSVLKPLKISVLSPRQALDFLRAP